MQKTGLGPHHHISLHTHTLGRLEIEWAPASHHHRHLRPTHSVKNVFKWCIYSERLKYKSIVDVMTETLLCFMGFLAEALAQQLDFQTKTLNSKSARALSSPDFVDFVHFSGFLWYLPVWLIVSLLEDFFPPFFPPLFTLSLMLHDLSDTHGESQLVWGMCRKWAISYRW